MADPAPITITAGGVTVTVAPLGWADLVGIPRELDMLGLLPLKTAADEEALGDAIVAFGVRIDSYSLGDVPPSRIPPVAMREFVSRWASGVRDAAIPPPDAGSSPLSPSTSSEAAPRRSRPKS